MGGKIPSDTHARQVVGVDAVVADDDADANTNDGAAVGGSGGDVARVMFSVLVWWRWRRYFFRGASSGVAGVGGVVVVLLWSHDAGPAGVVVVVDVIGVAGDVVVDVVVVVVVDSARVKF